MMNRFRWWILPLAAVVLAILFVPGKPQLLDDGGTVVRSALTYKIVDWNQASNMPLKGRQVYIFPDNFKTLRELEQLTRENLTLPHPGVGLRATVLELTETTALVEPVGEYAQSICDRISISLGKLPDIGAKVGDEVIIWYTGEILESYPAQIHATGWEFAK